MKLLDLTPELKEALGKDGKLAQQYSTLQKQNDIKDSQAAIDYVDAVVKRFNAIKNAPSSKPGLAEKKEKFITELMKHLTQMAVLSFSKPESASQRLSAMGLSSEGVKQIIEKMEQPGAPEDDLCSVALCVATSETSLICGPSNRYHQHTVYTGGGRSYGNTHYHR